MPTLRVDCLSDGLSTAWECVKHQQLADAVDIIEKLGQKCFQRWRLLVTTEGLGTHVASAIVGRCAHQANLPQVARERCLGDVPATLFQKTAKLLLASNRVTADELEDGFVSLSFARARGSIHGG